VSIRAFARTGPRPAVSQITQGDDAFAGLLRNPARGRRRGRGPAARASPAVPPDACAGKDD